MLALDLVSVRVVTVLNPIDHILAGSPFHQMIEIDARPIPAEMANQHAVIRKPPAGVHPNTDMMALNDLPEASPIDVPVPVSEAPIGQDAVTHQSSQPTCGVNGRLSIWKNWNDTE